MGKTLLLLVAVLTFGCKGESNYLTKEQEQATISSEAETNIDSLVYANTLQSLLNKIHKNEKIDPNFLAESIPEDETKYYILYSYTNPDTSEALRVAYWEREKLIAQNIRQGHLETIKRHLLFANIVDGEGAEGMFEDLNHYYTSQPDSFCVAIQQLMKEKDRKNLWRIDDLITKCN